MCLQIEFKSGRLFKIVRTCTTELYRYRMVVQYHPFLFRPISLNFNSLIAGISYGQKSLRSSVVRILFSSCFRIVQDVDLHIKIACPCSFPLCFRCQKKVFIILNLFVLQSWKNFLRCHSCFPSEFTNGDIPSIAFSDPHLCDKIARNDDLAMSLNSVYYVGVVHRLNCYLIKRFSFYFPVNHCNFRLLYVQSTIQVPTHKHSSP